jgi:hypothetical protein
MGETCAVPPPTGGPTEPTEPTADIVTSCMMSHPLTHSSFLCLVTSLWFELLVRHLISHSLHHLLPIISHQTIQLSLHRQPAALLLTAIISKGSLYFLSFVICHDDVVGYYDYCYWNYYKPASCRGRVIGQCRPGIS